MRPIRSVSVLMPTWQGMDFLERALTAIARQKLALAWDFLAIDSGSTDGTWELLGRFAETFPVPFRRSRIHPLEFDHGDTRNLLASRTEGDLLVYLTQDAIPTSDGWLAALAANFDDAKVGAAYCRNVPRADADVLTKAFSANDPGYAAGRREVRIDDAAAYARMSPYEKRILYNFNDVASAIRRELWELHPFPRTQFGEDVLMSRALLEGGFTVVYDDAATVEHSHDYSPEEMRARARIDGKFNAEWLDRICVASNADARTLAKRQLQADLAALNEDSSKTGAERATDLRLAAFQGLHEGGLTSKRRPPTRLLPRRDLSILYVVHGFPPDTWAGTEVYTLNLAKEMQRRGHRVAVLTRAPAAAGSDEFSISEDTLEGLRVLRLTHRLEHRSLAESYRQPAVERVFRRVLERERPDLVHFMHLIHLSAGLVGVAKELAIPTVITCHDYWSICARVQLIRPDGVRCEENMGSGCFLCLREKNLGAISTVKQLDPLAKPLLEAFTKGTHDFADLSARQPTVVGAYQSTDLQISPSRFLRQKLVDTAGFDPERFLYSDNGIRTDHVEALAKSRDLEGRVRFGFVGSLVWYKGGEVMLRAMKRLLSTRAVLHVHGDFQPDRDPHHAALAQLAGPNVTFHGRFDNARLSDVYSEIDVLLVPSLWWENSPITIHEAFLTKTPVVASGIGGMAEFVRDGIDGLHFAPGDDADLAAKMRRFLDEEGLLARLGSDPPPVKTIEEDAAATEYRYRAVCCVVRGAPAQAEKRILVEHSGHETAAREGPVERQGADMILLRPGGAAVEYEIAGSAAGARTIVIEQFAYGPESEVVLAGRALVDGVEIGRLAPFHASGRDEVHRESFSVELAPGARRLRLESSAAGAGASTHLRVRRVLISVREAGLSSLLSKWFGRPPEPSVVLDFLAVTPGRALADKDLPRAAVVVLNLNGRHHLDPCFQSLAALDYPKEKVELILVDNGSGDGSVDEMRAKHPSVRLVENDRNLGFSAGSNQGAHAAKEPDVLVFLNNDMRVEKDWLRELVAPIARRECQATTSKILSWDGKKMNSAGGGMNFSGIGIQYGYLEEPGPAFDFPRKTLFACGGSMAIDGQIFEAVGGFDEEFFAYYEDVDLGWRMWVQGHTCQYAPASVCYHHHSSTSKNLPREMIRLLQVRNPLLACVKNYDEKNLALVLAPALALALRRIRLIADLDDEKPFRIEAASSHSLGGPKGILDLARRKLEDHHVPIKRIAAADLIGIDDLLGNWEHWMARRAEVQGNRRRMDSEIFELFLKPRWCIEQDEGSIELQRDLFEKMGLDRLFPSGFDPESEAVGDAEGWTRSRPNTFAAAAYSWR